MTQTRHLPDYDHLDLGLACSGLRDRAATGGSLHTPVHLRVPGAGEVPASDVTIAIVRPLDAKGLTKATSLDTRMLRLHRCDDGTVPGDVQQEGLQAEWSFDESELHDVS